MAEEFTEEDLQTGIPLTEIPESGFEPTTMTLEPPAAPTEEIAGLEAAGFQWPAAEPVTEPEIPIEQAPTPAPTPLAGPHILTERKDEEPPPIDDETAWHYFDTTNDSLPPEDLEIRRREMARYYDAKKEEDAQREYYYYEDLYTNDAKRQEVLNRPGIVAAREGAKDPNLFDTATINNAFLEYQTGRIFADPSEAEAARLEYGRRVFGKPSMSHDSFFAAQKGFYEVKQKERAAAMDLRAEVFNDVWTGKYTTGGDTFMRWRDAHGDVVDAQNQKAFYWAQRKEEQNYANAADRIKVPGSLVLDAVQTYLRGDAKEGELNTKFVAAGEAMLALDPKDRALVWQGIKYITDSQKVDKGTVETVIENIRKAFVDRGIVGAATDVNMQSQDMKLEDTRQYLLSGDVRLRNSDGLPAEIDPNIYPLGSAEREIAERYLATQTHPATSQETSDLLRKTNVATGAIQMLREGKEILQTQIDPYRPVLPDVWGLQKTELGAYNLVESAPTMALNTVPIVGQSLMALSFASHEYNSMMLRDPLMDKRVASGLSIVSGQIQAVLEHFQIESMLGRSQFLRSLLPDLRTGKIGTVAKNFGIAFTEQNLQEAAQDFTSMIIPLVASELRPDMKPQDFGVEFQNFLNQRVDVMFALLVPTFVGTGISSWRDIKNPARDVFNDRMMERVGFSAEARARIMALPTLEERATAYREEYAKRKPEDIAAGYAATAADIDHANGHQMDVATPTMENRPLADGTAQWHVLNPDGNSLFHSEDYDIALDQYAQHTERLASERLAAEQAAAATEESQAATAEAEAELRLLPAASRASAGIVLDFERNEQPTPEQSESVRALEAALAEDPRTAKQPTRLVPARRRVDQTSTQAAQALDSFIQSFEKVFGRVVEFVYSGTDRELPFGGVVLPSRPNTIFLNAHGAGNITALLGHEWAHTLQVTNPILHREMTEAMRPLVIGWLEQEGLLKEQGYGESDVTEELVSNIVGDSFARPEFWAEVKRGNPSLFERIVRSIEEWFASIRAAVMGTEWGTEGFITNLDEMHKIISSAIEQARTAGPEVTAMTAAKAGLRFATRRGKAAQARAEGISREESVAAAFERMHAAPGERLGLLERIKREYARVRAENAAAEAAVGTEEGAVSEMRRVHAFAELNALVKALPPEIRGRIGGALTLAKARTTELSLTDFLVKRIAMIDRELERALRNEYRSRIKDLLSSFKPKKTEAGVLKSRIGADAQDVVNRLVTYTKMDGATVQREIDAIETTLAAGGLTPEEESALIIKQNELATFGAIEEMSAAELDAAHAELRSTIINGRASWGVTEEARLNNMRAKAAELVSILPKATPPGAAKSNRAKFTNWLRNFARNHTSFIQVLDRLFPGASFISDWQSKAIAQDSADQDYVRQTQQRLVDAIGAALGTKSTLRIGRALEKMGEANIPVPGGMASQRDAIQYLFAWGQPTVRERMINQGWTDEHIRVLQEATSDAASQALARFFHQEYEAIYQRANVVYRPIYGMNLPRIEGTYAPMRYHGAGGPIEMTPTGAVVSSGVTPSAVKARVAHNAKLRQVDSLQVFTEHLYQMSHWIQFAELIRETRGVLNNGDVKLVLEQSLGADGVIDLQNHLDSITRNGVTRSSEMKGLSALATHITKGVAVGAMSFNLHSAAVQGDSGLRWMTAVPMQRWGNVLLLHRWLPNIAKAWHSDTVQRRVKQGASPAIRTAMEQSNLTPSLLLRAVDIGFWPINMFDGALTSLSSAIVYTDAIQQGMTNEQAMQKMDEAIARFSQPIGITAKTQALATTGPLGRSLLLFMADPMLKTSLSMEGLMNISRGIRAKDISLIEKGFRSIVAVEIWSLVSQMILNAWAHYAGDDEEEDEYWLFKHWERAMLLAPIQGFFIAGDVADGLARAFFGEKWYEKQVPLFRFARDVQTTVTHWEDLLDPSSADFQKELSRVIKLGGTAVGSGWAAAASAIQRAVALKEKMEEK